ncbi:MAG: RNA-binding S4 domain-containing protein [Deferribacteraceae bacterium]|nr:RNA-binding S4 domain-containing protein [Deferribacteraceae bacterium]
MRLDKFLKVTQLIKRRAVAKETADENAVMVNGRTAKPSIHLKSGDIIEIDMWNFYKKIRIIQLPSANSIPKNKTDEYIETLEYKKKTAG